MTVIGRSEFLKQRTPKYLMYLQKLQEKWVKTVAYTGMALLFPFLSACSPVADEVWDIYAGFSESRDRSEYCVFLGEPKERPSKRDISSYESGLLEVVDGYVARHSKLIRHGENQARYLREEDSFYQKGFQKVYQTKIREAWLLPGEHDVSITIYSERATWGDLVGFIFGGVQAQRYDSIRFKGFQCEAGKTYRFYYSRDVKYEKTNQWRVWVESEGQVVFEGWKSRSDPLTLFDLSKAQNAVEQVPETGSQTSSRGAN